jgi:oligopeptide/dipeptide ABC transporter ATP-binding protein
VPSPLRPGGGCRFAPRCIEARDNCTRRAPLLSTDSSGRRVDCVLYDQSELVVS